MNDIRNPSAPRWGYALLVRLHFYAGLFVGPFIFVAALSGALFALTPQIENWLYQTELTTENTGEAQPLAAQILTARDHIGDRATLAAVRPAPQPGQTTRVMFAVDGLQPFEHQAVFVDPVSLDIRGELVVYGTSGTPAVPHLDRLCPPAPASGRGRALLQRAGRLLALAGGAGWPGIVVAPPLTPRPSGGH